MATLNGNDLGTIKNESQTKDSSLLFFPLPLSNSDEALLTDLMGTSRTITVDGTKIDSVKANLQTFVTTMEAIQNGAQAGVTYVGDFITTNKTVEIQTFNWNWMLADPTRIHYTLTLFEGTPI